MNDLYVGTKSILLVTAESYLVDLVEVLRVEVAGVTLQNSARLWHQSFQGCVEPPGVEQICGIAVEVVSSPVADLGMCCGGVKLAHRSL